MMGTSTERIVDKVIKYGTVFAEVGPPIWALPYGKQKRLI